MNDFDVRPENETETDEISDVVAAAFGRRDEADIVAALRESSAFRPALSLVADRDDEIVGHVMFTDATLDDDEERGALVLAPLAVAPDHQRSGVGSRLVRAGLDAARTAGDDLVFLHGDPNYYGQFGFTAAVPAGFENPINLPDEHFQAVSLAGDGSDEISGIPTDETIMTLTYPAPLRE